MEQKTHMQTKFSSLVKKEIGRPHEFSAENFCNKIPQIMEDIIIGGGHDASLCVKLGTSRETLHQYRKNYPAVEAAYQLYRLHKAAFYEKWFTNHVSDKSFNATSAIFLMKNIDQIGR